MNVISLALITLVSSNYPSLPVRNYTYPYIFPIAQTAPIIEQVPVNWRVDYAEALDWAVRHARPLVIWFDEFQDPTWATQKLASVTGNDPNVLGATLLYAGRNPEGDKIRETFCTVADRAIFVVEPSGNWIWFRYYGTPTDAKLWWLSRALQSGKPAYGTLTESPESNAASPYLLVVPASH